MPSWGKYAFFILQEDEGMDRYLNSVNKIKIDEYNKQNVAKKEAC